MEDCQLKLDSKKQDIEKLQEQEKALYTTFTAALGENNKFESFLTRVFKKKIKRAKKKTQAEEGSDEESEDEDSDEDLSSSDEEDSDAEELDDSVCPPGCDQALFDQVCYLSLACGDYCKKEWLTLWPRGLRVGIWIESSGTKPCAGQCGVFLG